MQVGLKPFVRNNVLDFVDVWSLEKLKESSLNIIDVTKLSDSDEKQKEILKNT
ncbi:hypothetical protein HYU50_01860 [Candidatus Woesearchaeota archaeon]|nr:hypothetical protein [Candidatus Woesearchaeota archaeon]